jgi:glycosyltransferase involved in cell wall biosynthesis
VTAAPAPGRERILIVVNAAWFFVSHRLPVAVAARDAGFDVHVAASPDETVAQVEAAGLPFHPVPMRRGLAGLSSDLAGLDALMRLYRRLRPALVHHVTIKPVVLGSIAARVAGVPRVLNAVAGLGSMFLATGATGTARARLVTAVLRQVRGTWALVPLPERVGPRRLRRARHRRTNAHLPSAWLGRRSPALPADPRAIGHAVVVLPARLLQDKGVTDFVDAARRLRAAGAGVRCVLVGALDADNPTALAKATVESWVAEGVVEWWGHRADMPAVLAGAHVVCLPSYREGMPKALLEAAAAGRPIVATDVPGCRECVRPGETGLLVPVRDPVALAAAIASLLDDPERRRAMGRAGRALAEREFGVARVVAATLDAYRRCLA